jgi:ferric-dicitrate binding protein FerR (iron transport regulator)
MTEQEHGPISAEEGRAREALRQTQSPQPDPAFRTRLREEFISGRLSERKVFAIRKQWFSRPAARVVLAAAASVAIIVGALMNRGPAWVIMSSSGTGMVQVDGDAVPIERLEELRDRIRPGAEVTIPERGRLELMAKRTLLLELTPGTRFTLPPPPARWLGRDVELYARSGILRATTGPGFPGARLMIRSPEAEIHVIGTTFTVILEPTGTCVCVLEGTAEVGPRGGAMMSVASGHRGYVFRNGQPPVVAAIRPSELIELARFRSTRHYLLGGE